MDVKYDEKVKYYRGKNNLSGVGEAGSAITNLKNRGLDEVIQSLVQPTLGVCLGLQLMAGIPKKAIQSVWLS
jgi:glutamine amidotransferase